jgi:hypothetical protein
VTQESKNQRLHHLLGRCVHDWKPQIQNERLIQFRCAKCPQTSPNGPPCPDYTGSIQDAFEAQAIVIERVGLEIYGERLGDMLRVSQEIVDWALTTESMVFIGLAVASAASAERRVDAMIAALSQEEK